MNKRVCVLCSVLLLLTATAIAQTKERSVKRRWLLEPGVNCKIEDYQSVFGLTGTFSTGSTFDDSWASEDGNVSASADNNGSLSSSGETYQFAYSHGLAGVVRDYTADISEPMDVGLQATYKVTQDVVDALPSEPGSGGAYARNLLRLRVTDEDDHKEYSKWLTNHGAIAGGFIMGETMDKSDTPLTFTLEPGHHYKLEAFIETKAAGFADPNSTACGSGEARMKVKILTLGLVPKNPPWVSVWSTEYVPRTFDTYDRYERILKRDKKNYFPAEFKLCFSAGGDYTAADSYVRVDCRGSQVVKVTGDLPGASAQTGQVSFALPVGGGEWTSTILLDSEVDPNKAPVSTLPAPMVRYLMTVDSVDVGPSTTTYEYDPSNWGILIGNEAVMFEDWGTGAILQALREQYGKTKPQLALNTENLCFKNPKTGEVTPVDQMVPAGVKLAPTLKRPTTTPTDAEIQLALDHEVCLYSEIQAIGVHARAANGNVDFVADQKADIKYNAVFDFLPRPQPKTIEAR